MLFGCGVNPVGQCQQAATASCQKLFECWTSDVDRIRLMLGPSAEACVQAAHARCESEALLCEAPKTWDAAQADHCIRAMAAISCAALRAGAAVSSCSNTCK